MIQTNHNNGICYRDLLSISWGVVFGLRSYLHICACRMSKTCRSPYLYYASFSTHQCTTLARKALNFLQFGCFFAQFSLRTSNHRKWGVFLCRKPSDQYVPNFWGKKNSKRQAHIYVYNANVRPPIYIWNLIFKIQWTFFTFLHKYFRNAWIMHRQIIWVKLLYKCL